MGYNLLVVPWVFMSYDRSVIGRPLTPTEDVRGQAEHVAHRLATMCAVVIQTYHTLDATTFLAALLRIEESCLRQKTSHVLSEQVVKFDSVGNRRSQTRCLQARLTAPYREFHPPGDGPSPPPERPLALERAVLLRAVQGSSALVTYHSIVRG